MSDADPQTPPNEDGTVREEAPASDRLLPPFLLVQTWEPDAYDEVLLEWWGEGYLMECGSLHADERLSQHDHGRVLALVVVDEQPEELVEARFEAKELEEDWVEECRLIASS